MVFIFLFLKEFGLSFCKVYNFCTVLCQSVALFWDLPTFENKILNKKIGTLTHFFYPQKPVLNFWIIVFFLCIYPPPFICKILISIFFVYNPKFLNMCIYWYKIWGFLKQNNGSNLCVPF